MPKAAAPSPTEWATVHPNFSGFNIDDLNRVVLDYGPIELEAASRRDDRPALISLGVKVLFVVAIIGLAGPLFAAIAFIAGGGAGEMSDDVSPIGFVISAYVGCGLGCLSLLFYFVPWARSTHRQWDRSLFGFAIFVLVPTVVLLGAVVMSDSPQLNRGTLLMAPLVALLVGGGVIISEFRLYSREKPPSIDVARLTDREMQILLALRHKALKTLRSRSIVSYDDFDGYDKSPLVSTR